MWHPPSNGSGARGLGQPSPPPPPPPYRNLSFTGDPQNPNYYLQNLSSAFLLNTHLLQQQQNPIFPFQPGNLNFPLWNPNFNPLQQPLLPQIPPQQQPVLPPPPPPQQPKPLTQQDPLARPTQQNQAEAVSHIRKEKDNAAAKETLKEIEAAVKKAGLGLLSAKQNVSAWKVSQAVLVALQVDSWDLLGVKMQEIPSMRRLMVTESKISAFIHCFVGVRKITSVYDLNVAICENEGIEHFEELELGPLLRHPLVSHYFSVDAHVTEVFKITSEDVILELSQFMDTCKNQAVVVDDFLHFLAKKLSVKGKDRLGVRMQSIGMHISFINEARRSESLAMGKCQKELARNYDNKDTIPKGSEDGILKKCQEAAGKKSNGKGTKSPLFSLQKKGLEKCFSVVHQRVESFSSENTEFGGKHIRFVSSSCEDKESDDITLEDKVSAPDEGEHSPISLQNVSSSGRVSRCPYPSATEERLRPPDARKCRKSPISLQNVSSSAQVSRCPYPSATEEKLRLGLIGEVGGPFSPANCSPRKNKSSEPLKNKRKRNDASCNISLPSKLVTGDEGIHKCPPNWKDDNATSDVDLTLSVDSINTFVSRWKETCNEFSLSEILELMLELYNPSHSRAATHHKAKVKLMFSSHPFIGMLNVALKSIKLGMWDSIYDAIQAVNQFETTNTLSPKRSEYETIDVEPGKKNARMEVEADKVAAVPDMFNLTPTAAKPRAYHQSPTSKVEIDDIELCLVSDSPELEAFLTVIRGGQTNPGTPNVSQALLTGRVGERVAYQYLVGKFGAEVVKWVNKDRETGLPYDIVIEGDDREFVEVKATISPKKDWFAISTREWQFAVEKGDSFSVVHVVLGSALARVTTLKNLMKQCQSGNLELVLKMLTQ